MIFSNRKPKFPFFVRILAAILLIFLIFWILALECAFGASSGDSVDVNLYVTGCNNNAICEPLSGEDIASCPLDCAPSTPTPSGGSRRGGTFGFNPNPGDMIYDVSVVVDRTVATVFWKTRTPLRSTFLWGQSDDYELGSLSEVAFGLNHSVSLYDLSPGTLYYFKINAQNISHELAATYHSAFATKADVPYFFPDDVTHFSVTVLPGSSIENPAALLRWQNPSAENFDYVRLVRSTFFFSNDPFVGKVIYEGKGISLIDPEIKKGEEYYYTIFAHFTDGRFSAGVTGKLFISGANDQSAPSATPAAFIFSPKDEPFYSKPSFSSGALKNITDDNVSFYQFGKKLPIIGDVVEVVPHFPFIVRLGVGEAETRHVETVILGLRDASGGISNYILPLSPEDPLSYVGKISPLPASAKYEYLVSIYEHVPEARIDLRGTLVTGKDATSFPSKNDCKKTSSFSLFFMILAALILLGIISLKDKKDEKDRKIDNLS